MRVLSILSPGRIKVPLEAADKVGAVTELIDLLAEEGSVSDPGEALRAVLAREGIRTTGIGHRVAMPHAKTDAVASLAMAFGRTAEPVDFKSIDGRGVRLVALLLSPPEQAAGHIQALARVARLLSFQAFRRRLMEAQTPGAVLEAFAEHEREHDRPASAIAPPRTM